MTVRDAETLEVLRDEPELLAVADAVAATQRRRRVPRRLIIAVAAIVVAAAVALVAPWQDDDGAGSLIAQRALAALPARGPVLHAVLEYRLSTWVNLETGRPKPVVVRAESWYDAERGLFRTRASRSGKLVVDATIANAGDSFDAAIVMSFAKAAEAIRKALLEGDARVIGKGRVRGRDVYWIAPTRPEDENGFDVAVDRDTYEIVQLRGSESERADESLTVSTFEYLDRRAGVFGTPRDGESLSGVSAGSGASVGTTTLANARGALGDAPAVWAGPAVDGMRIGSIELLDVQSGTARAPGPHGKVVTLTYGDSEPIGPPTPESVSIEQASLADAAGRDYLGGPSLPPSGYVELQSGTAGSGKRQFTRWSGLLRHDGLLVQVVAPSRERVLEVARSLRPIPADAG